MFSFNQSLIYAQMPVNNQSRPCHAWRHVWSFSEFKFPAHLKWKRGEETENSMGYVEYSPTSGSRRWNPEPLTRHWPIAHVEVVSLRNNIPILPDNLIKLVRIATYLSIKNVSYWIVESDRWWAQTSTHRTNWQLELVEQVWTRPFYQAPTTWTIIWVNSKLFCNCITCMCRIHVSTSRWIEYSFRCLILGSGGWLLDWGATLPVVPESIWGSGGLIETNPFIWALEGSLD